MKKKTKKLLQLEQKEHEIHAWLVDAVIEHSTRGNVTYEALLRCLLDDPDCPIPVDDIPSFLFRVWEDSVHISLALAPITEAQAVSVANRLGFDFPKNALPLTNIELERLDLMGRRNKTFVNTLVGAFVGAFVGLQWITDYIKRHSDADSDYDCLLARLLDDPDCPVNRKDRAFLFSLAWAEAGLPPPTKQASTPDTP